MSRSNWIIKTDAPDRLVILDVGPWEKFMSVTNDAEAVVESIAPRPGGRKLYYVDSEGQMDELKVSDGQFAGFAPGPKP